jgi:succinate dehydrogenase flavin-adding protein (antitoxin of CptAB toxin-antitoxin module)
LLELDLLLGSFACEHVHSLSDSHLASFHLILAEENPNLLKWLTRQHTPPDRLLCNPAFSLLMQHSESRFHRSPPSTRAPPNTSWVQAWHDSGKDLRSSPEAPTPHATSPTHSPPQEQSPERNRSSVDPNDFDTGAGL